MSKCFRQNRKLFVVVFRQKTLGKYCVEGIGKTRQVETREGSFIKILFIVSIERSWELDKLFYLLNNCFFLSVTLIMHVFLKVYKNNINKDFK